MALTDAELPRAPESTARSVGPGTVGPTAPENVAELFRPHDQHAAVLLHFGFVALGIHGETFTIAMGA